MYFTFFSFIIISSYKKSTEREFSIEEKPKENSAKRVQFNIDDYLKKDEQAVGASRLKHFEIKIQEILEDDPTAEIYQEFLEKIKRLSPVALVDQSISFIQNDSNSNKKEKKKKKDFLKINSPDTKKINSSSPKKSTLPQINNVTSSERIASPKVRSKSVMKSSNLRNFSNEIYEPNNTNQQNQEVNLK